MEKYQTEFKALSDEEKGGVSFPLPSGEYTGKLMEVMAPVYRNKVKNRLKPGEYDQLLDCQKGALLSIAYTGPAIIGNNLRKHITGYLTAADDEKKVENRALA